MADYGININVRTKDEKLKQKYDWFMIVRNPYDRILSEYYCEWGGIGYKNIVGLSTFLFIRFSFNLLFLIFHFNLLIH